MNEKDFLKLAEPRFEIDTYIATISERMPDGSSKRDRMFPGYIFAGVGSKQVLRRMETFFRKKMRFLKHTCGERKEPTRWKYSEIGNEEMARIRSIERGEARVKKFKKGAVVRVRHFAGEADLVGTFEKMWSKNKALVKVGSSGLMREVVADVDSLEIGDM